ncbi:hypothetical protein IQ07DRAFT_152612 [Pyrenochaeta sp. DS3sAY3a]|nr:hypothetical protein IQ07DRAFT_152612 [Pyrenochaeta sp. DS3sAY3a]
MCGVCVLEPGVLPSTCRVGELLAAKTKILGVESDGLDADRRCQMMRSVPWTSVFLSQRFSISLGVWCPVSKDPSLRTGRFNMHVTLALSHPKASQQVSCLLCYRAAYKQRVPPSIFFLCITPKCTGVERRVSWKRLSCTRQAFRLCSLGCMPVCFGRSYGRGHGIHSEVSVYAAGGNLVSIVCRGGYVSGLPELLGNRSRGAGVEEV